MGPNPVCHRVEMAGPGDKIIGVAEDKENSSKVGGGGFSKSRNGLRVFRGGKKKADSKQRGRMVLKQQRENVQEDN